MIREYILQEGHHVGNPRMAVFFVMTTLRDSTYIRSLSSHKYHRMLMVNYLSYIYPSFTTFIFSQDPKRVILCYLPLFSL